MSVTITIQGNLEHCRASGQLRIATEECYCTSKLLGYKPRKNCENCKDEGKYQRMVLPFEMRLSNERFSTLWQALRLVEVCTGWIDGRTLRKAIRAADPDDFDTLMHAKAYQIDPVRHISRDRVANYMLSLSVLCDVAEERENPIVWH